MRRLIDALCGGCVLLAAVQLPGAALDYVIRSDIGPPVVALGVVLAIACIALVAHRAVTGNWRVRTRLLPAAVVAFALAAGFAQLAPVVMSQAFSEVGDLGVLIPTPGRRTRDCRGAPLRCHDHVLNELGFRGTLARRDRPDDRLAVMIGDS